MNLAAIRAKAKEFIGDSGYDDVALDLVINRMYQRVLPLEFSLEALKAEFGVITTEGECVYTVDPDLYLTIKEPVYFNGIPGSLYRNKSNFYSAYPQNPLHNITGATIAVGGPFTIAGKYDSLFGTGRTFRVDGSSGNDGMWTVQNVAYAADVTTITVTGNVTDATADGTIYEQTNNAPTDVLYWGHYLYVRPHPDTNNGAHYFFTADTVTVPTALTLVTDEPIEKLWGMILAIDSAIDIMSNTDRTDEIKVLVGLRTIHAALISAKEIKGFADARSVPQF